MLKNFKGMVLKLNLVTNRRIFQRNYYKAWCEWIRRCEDGRGETWSLGDNGMMQIGNNSE